MHYYGNKTIRVVELFWSIEIPKFLLLIPTQNLQDLKKSNLSGFQGGVSSRP
jgi:hypothetical protein